jgi:hypothetical protein
MSDDFSNLVFGSTADGEQGMIAVEGARFTDLPSLLEHLPALANSENATDLARVANHLARRKLYKVIDDPAAFEAAYRETFEAEADDVAWEQGVFRLRDFGMPDFSAITEP